MIGFLLQNSWVDSWVAENPWLLIFLLLALMAVGVFFAVAGARKRTKKFYEEIGNKPPELSESEEVIFSSETIQIGFPGNGSHKLSILFFPCRTIATNKRIVCWGMKHDVPIKPYHFYYAEQEGLPKYKNLNLRVLDKIEVLSESEYEKSVLESEKYFN